MKRLIFYIILLFISITACTTTSPKQPTKQRAVNMENLSDLQRLRSDNISRDQDKLTSNIRLKALKETAMTIGAQGGLSVRSKQINQNLLKRQKTLAKIFDFNGMLLDHNVLPPVLIEGKNAVHLAGPNSLRISDRTYKIVKQARFVTTAPTWRDYLLLHYQKPELPDKTLLPKTDEEHELWIKYINMGWQKGVAQADSIYDTKLAQLHRDFKGMALYRKLLTQNMVSKPFVAKSHMGITSNDDHTEMAIGDRILRITATPRFTTRNSRTWQPALIKK